MTTYRELLARRDEFDFNTPEWKEVNDLITAYLRAQILAGNIEYANMVVSDLGDAIESGCYEYADFKDECDGYVEWFRKWNFDEYADELESCING